MRRIKAWHHAGARMEALDGPYTADRFSTARGVGVIGRSLIQFIVGCSSLINYLAGQYDSRQNCACDPRADVGRVRLSTRLGTTVLVRVYLAWPSQTARGRKGFDDQWVVSPVEWGKSPDKTDGEPMSATYHNFERANFN